MKNRLLKILRKYWGCILFSLIMVIGLFLTMRFADLCETGKGYIRLNLYETYLILGIPLLSFAYGCVSYVVLKKLWVQQLILLVINIAYWIVFSVGSVAQKLITTAVGSAYPVVFSLIGTLITAFICYIVKITLENEKKY